MKKLLLNDTFILWLIIINTIIIFLSGFNFNNIVISTFSIIDYVITVAFILEATFKIKEFGTDYFKSNWNVFDFVLIILCIPSLISYHAHLLDTNLSILLTLRVLRIFRIFKTIRFLKFIPGMDNLIRGINRALKTSLIALIGYAIYVFIAGVISFYIFKDISPEHFSNPMESLYSIFKVFTVEGWYEIPESICSDLEGFKCTLIYAYFIFILISGGIIGLSLVNSIFVDAMVSDNNKDLEDKVDELNKKIEILLTKIK